LVAVRTDGLVDHVHRVTVPCVVTLIPGTGHAAVGGASSEKGGTHLMPLELAPPPETVGNSDNSHAVQTIAVLPPDPATMDLTEAGCIVAGGNGLVGGAAAGTARFDTLREVGSLIGASLGGTRVASDAGWIPFERQIGTTGVEVSPRVYLAFGISGATQHITGLGSPDHILSVNTDPSCPMMGMSEVAIVADAFAVVQSLHRLLTVGHDRAGTQ
jgi:electron transfer flavoprotein alpha subunit